MSVFTKITHAELASFLERYPVGRLLGLQGIGEGVENTNYFVDTDDGRWVLTIFERTRYEDLPFFLALMEHLARRGIPTAMPMPTRDGERQSELKSKPAAIGQRLSGASVLFPSSIQCREVGGLLAQLHIAGQTFPMRAANSRGADWRQQCGETLLNKVDAETAELIRDELAQQAALDLSSLPQGIIHADLFRDNVLFNEDEVSGVIDFYYACNEALLYDLAVTVNDWCMDDARGRPNATRWRAVVQAYRSRRELEPEELKAWPMVLRAAALRFWLSRLEDWHKPREGDMVHVKDPDEYKRILLYYRSGAPLPE